jgi:hypothetical protein
MRAPLVIVAIAGSLMLAGCGSAGALDDAAVPESSASASASASTSASGSASPSPSASASASTASPVPLVTASSRPSSSASPSDASATPSASGSAISTVLRTSTVTVYFGGGFDSGSFVWDGGYAVSSGQPWEGVTSSAPGKEVSIQVLAGRHGTSEVAEWFRQRASAAVVISDIVVLDQWPSELNFAFTGTLTANGSAISVVIGQGNDGFENNWWVGGESWTSFDICYPGIVGPEPPSEQFFIPVGSPSLQVLAPPEC